MSLFFSIQPEILTNLGPQDAVDLFRQLLWAEANRCDVARSLINVPNAIYVKDGGIDAEVKDAKPSKTSGLIKDGLTRYQIKSGKIQLDSRTIEEILFKENSKELKTRIKSCLDKQGILVIVLFGWDNPDSKDDEYVNKFKEKLTTIDPKYANVKIEILRQNQIVSFLQLFPSLCLKLTGGDGYHILSHGSWSNQSEMRQKFYIDKDTQKLIDECRDKLRNNQQSEHMRVTGEPGIGKTKFVLELTRTDDLAPLVIYCDSPETAKNNLLYHIARADNNFNAILVVDECDKPSMSDLWNTIEPIGSRIKLITIYSEFEEFSGRSKFIDLSKLDDEQIGKILEEEYGLTKDQANRWIPYCSGSPRVAHVIGRNLKQNPDDLLKSPDTVDVWNRFIAEKDLLDSEIFKERKAVLLWLSLFKKFGYEPSIQDEFQLLAKKIEKDEGIRYGKIVEIVNDLRRRKVLQGRTTLYISPKLFHIWLWTQWWQKYGKIKKFKLEEFIVFCPDSNPPGVLTGQMQAWFFDMFRYAKESEEASAVVKELLEPDGPFGDGNFIKTQLGAQFLFALTEADSESALKCLEKTVGSWNRDQLLQFTIGRREVINALQTIVAEKELFVRAARILLLLAEAENERWTNNATEIFAGLFSLGISPTAASPEERFPVLKKALESESKERRLVALKACDIALESEHFIGFPEHGTRGLRGAPERWVAKIDGELFDAYNRVWNLLIERLDYMEEDERQQAIDILTFRARGLMRFTPLAHTIVDTLRTLTNKQNIDKRKILASVIKILHYDSKRLPKKTREMLEKLRDELVGDNFHSLMTRYVGMSLLEDSFDEKGNRVDQVQLHIEKLVQQAIENNELLHKELGWLTTTKAENGYRFGYELAKRDVGFSLLPKLLEAQRDAGDNASAYFLGGYFRGLQEIDRERWEKELDKLVEDVKLRRWVPELTWRSEMTDRAAKRVLSMTKSGIIDVQQLNIFALGGSVNKLSEDVFIEWIEFLLSKNDYQCVELALNLHCFYFLHSGIKRTLPDELTMRILTHEVFLGKDSESDEETQPRVHYVLGGETMLEYYWAELGKAYVREYPEKSLNLAYKMLEYFGKDKSVLQSHSQTIEVLTEIANRYPIEVWEQTKKYLGPPIDSRSFHIEQWLCGRFFDEEEGFLSMVPIDNVLKWVDEDVENRAWYLASFVPKKPFSAEGKICPREVLVRYGNRKDVRRNLMTNFAAEVFSGSTVLHFQEKKEQLLKLKEGESDANVKSWIDEYVDDIDREIKKSVVEEERHEF